MFRKAWHIFFVRLNRESPKNSLLGAKVVMYHGRLQSLKQRVYPWKKWCFSETILRLPFLGGQTAHCTEGWICCWFQGVFRKLAASQLRVNDLETAGTCDSRIWTSGYQQHLEEHSRKQQKYVGGWTNPSEKYDRQIGSSPQILGWT